MGLSMLAKVVALLVLGGVFSATVLLTPRIWKQETRADEPGKPGSA